MSKLFLTALVILATLLASASGVAARKDLKDRTVSDADAQALSQALASLDCPRPKPRVAIYSFNATGKLAAFEGYNVGDGLAAQLATELTRTGCFIVLDRTGLGSLLREQELTLAGVVSRETGPAAGRLVGAEVLIKGTITEFEPNQRGRGLKLGLGLPNVPLGVRIGRNGNRAQVALDLSIVDATTGQVRSAHRVAANAVSGGWTIGLDHERGSIGGDAFAKSPLGRASRNALGQGILHIAENLSGLPWRSQIVDAVGETLYLNAGLASGIEAGETYRVSTVVRTLVDPGTGLLLDRVEQVVGEVRILSVQERYAIAEPLAGIQVQRGDYVHP
jgi:curli biogenesis system outer membrane secretion channel CsgG